MLVHLFHISGTLIPLSWSTTYTITFPWNIHWIPQYPPKFLHIWVNYNSSLTWIVRPFGDDFPYSSWFQGSGEQWGRYNLPRKIYPYEISHEVSICCSAFAHGATLHRLMDVQGQDLANIELKKSTREEYLVLTIKKYNDGLILGIYVWFLMVENIMGFSHITSLV